MMNNVTFIGLGVMGAPMAGHLAKSGLTTTIYNRDASKTEKWLAENEGSTNKNITSVVKDAQVVLLCLSDDQSVQDTLLGAQGVFESVRAGTIIVDHTTTSAKLAKQMSDEAQRHGVHFLDAPVSGGQAGAQNARLTIMVGGDKTVFVRAKSVLDVYAQALTWMGESGSGQLTKMVNQLCIAGLVQGLSEGLAFSEKAGLDTKRVLQVISKGAAQSWQMENRGETMVDDKFEFGFAVDHMRKDLGLCFDQAQAIGAKTPVAKLVDQFYAELQAQGGARWDTSSLIRRLV